MTQDHLTPTPAKMRAGVAAVAGEAAEGESGMWA